MDPIREHVEVMTRRHFFGRNAMAVGTAARQALRAHRPPCAFRAAPLMQGQPTCDDYAQFGARRMRSLTGTRLAHAGRR